MPPLLPLAVVAASALALTACSSSPAPGGSPSAPAVSTSSDSSESALPEGWAWAEGEGAPTAEAEPQLPVTVADATDTEVEIDDASRIIVGGDDVAAIIGSLGLADLVYAAPTNSVSEVATNVPNSFEYSQNTGVEGLLSMEGTLFIGNNVKRHGEVAAKFRDAGTDAVVLDDQQSVAEKIRDIGEFLGVRDAAETMAKTVEQQLEEASTIAAGGNVADLRILQVTARGAGGANAVVGTGTAGADITEAIGAVNVGVEAGLRGYSVKYSDEGLLDTEPDVILVTDSDLEVWGGLDGFLEAFPTLKDTPAGQANRFIVMPTEQLKVAGPATGAGAVALAKALAESEG